MSSMAEHHDLATAQIQLHDGLLNDTGRSMYLKHIEGFGADRGVEVLDLRGAGPTSL